MRRMADLFHHPEREYKIVHVAGTNGKGSTVAMIDSILRASGMRVGRFTSPHLFRFNERIVVDGEEISHDAIGRLVKEIRMVAQTHGVEQTFFEFTSLMAFLHFARSEVECAVIETGLGGRLDATNIVQPEISIITNIAMDHANILGDTLAQIAREKAGIIKPGRPVLIAEQPKEAEDILRHVAHERTSELTVVHPDDSLHPSLAGRHQIQNASLAFAAASMLGVDDETIRKGISSTVWPGRMQVLCERPLVLVDAAHNPAGMRALKESLPPGLSTLLFAASQGKQYGEMLDIIAPGFDRIIVTQPSFKQGDISAVRKAASRHAHTIVEEDIAEAVRMALENPGVLITGSLYMIGDAIASVQARLGARKHTRR